MQTSQGLYLRSRFHYTWCHSIWCRPSAVINRYKCTLATVSLLYSQFIIPSIDGWSLHGWKSHLSIVHLAREMWWNLFFRVAPCLTNKHLNPLQLALKCWKTHLGTISDARRLQKDITTSFMRHNVSIIIIGQENSRACAWFSSLIATHSSGITSVAVPGRNTL